LPQSPIQNRHPVAPIRNRLEHLRSRAESRLDADAIKMRGFVRCVCCASV
jgi:hypothetical protein